MTGAEIERINHQLRFIGRQLEEDRECPFLKPDERNALANTYLHLVRQREAAAGQEEWES